VSDIPLVSRLLPFGVRENRTNLKS
jgi:hypothetical protein